MKSKVFITGLMVLMSLSLLSCGGGTSGGGSGAPGSQSDDTGIQIQSVVLAPSSATASTDIDVFSNPDGCGGSTGSEAALTDALVTMTINAVAYNPDTNFSPFPANLTECFVSYTSAVIGAPIIEAETIYSPNCTFNEGTTSCDFDLLNIARKLQWYADITPLGSGKFVPSEYPTRYTVLYTCNFKNQFGQTGELGGKIDIDLADWCSQ